MKPAMLSIIIACAGIAGACAHAPPRELVDAREAYRRASTGPAAKVAPAEVHVAGKALSKAEQSFEDDHDSYLTRDLAYVAQRRAQLAEATASIKTKQRSQAASRSDFEDTQGDIVDCTKEDLADEQKARAEADQRAAASAAALAKLAAVKDEPRGTVITLSGSVLFASNQATLLPEARRKLDQVADALLESAERNIIVEGHTDSQGSGSHNLDLSQRRADAVRDYIVQRGYEADRIKALGLGEDRPVAGNRNAEGRANNRRVEIVIERDAQLSTR
jgi:outer membrane protein OmpA-like peptidoglycan-associated protein